MPPSLLAEPLAALISLVTTDPSAGGSLDPVTWLINAGSLGVIILLVVTGQLRTKAEVNQLNARIAYQDQRIADQDDLIKAFQLTLGGQTLPALARSAQVFERMPSTDTTTLDALAQTRDQVTALTKLITEMQRGAGGP